MNEALKSATSRVETPEPTHDPRAASSRRTQISTALGAALLIKGLVVAIIVSAMAFTSVLGCAQRHGHDGDPEHLREFAEWRVEKALKKVDATSDQQERVMTVVDELIADLTAMRENRGELHEALVAQLTAESIDRIALEAMRAEKMAELDVASRRVVDAVASVGEILSQDQRLELAVQATSHGNWRRGHHGWDRQ